MSETKISLSPEELSLVIDASVILTKNAIIQKTIKLFGQLQEGQQKLVVRDDVDLPDFLRSSNSKITKGEYYKGLPYVVLDYPRLFDKKNIAAIRTMFWWGHFFSITMHLSGSWKKRFEPNIFNSLDLLKQNGFYYCIHDSPWEHDFDQTNYKLLSEFDEVELISKMAERDFIKLAFKWPVDRWNMASADLLHYFTILLNLIQISRRDGEKGL